METQQLLQLIIDTAEDFKAINLVVLKVSGICDFADYFVIMSGTSGRRVQSITEEMSYRCKHAGRQALDVEGLTGGEWCLLDFGDIVVHIFQPKKRVYYDLENLWQEAEIVHGKKDEGPE